VKREKQEERVRRKADMIAKVAVRFDCDESWSKKLLIEQAERRGITYARAKRKEELIDQIEQHDAQLNAATLCEHLQSRGLVGTSTTRCSVLKNRLVKYDRAQQHPESVRDEMMTQREESSEDEQESEMEDETEEEVSEEGMARKRKRGA